ncbi:PRA1 family protein B2-like [Zingiber officinale]|uniref:PRA1 family protein n=1 Tax=Zingiber officinale TaxID=94328 RepID=A0A8J5L1J9_ZINOF|nr:PRA1 family protein B2-like [Zingiber officinale]KAG6501417.1 hypothetical protein ZIOFF_041297 [Zingiber officinale]
MMSSNPAPPILPISHPIAGDADAAPISSPSFSVFLSHLSDSLRRSLSELRPWSELADRSAFSRPDSLADASSRLRKNLTYFRINYAAIVAAVVAVSLATSPFSLIVLLALLTVWCLLYLFRPSDPPLVLFGRAISDRETLGGLAILSVLVVFLTSVGSIVVSAIMAGAALVVAHGAFRIPEDLFLDEKEPDGSSGFLPFLGGARPTTTTASSDPAIIAARV